MKRSSLISLVLLTTAACSTDEPGRLPRVSDAAPVTVSMAYRAAERESFPASVVAERTAEVATRTSGTVRRVAVEVGARVREGDLLLSLDDEDVTARVRAAEAARTLAELTFERMRNLARDGAASRQELDRATAALEAARSAEAGARAQLAYTAVRAPFDGVVSARGVDAGDLAVPGMPLFTLVSHGRVKVVADLPARLAGRVTPGAEVRVTTTGLGETLGRVARVVPALGGASHTFRVEVIVPNDDASMVPGAFARLALDVGAPASMWLPADAIVRRGQLEGVYSVEDGVVRLRWLRLGRTRGESVEVLSGPTGALAVVRRPASTLSDGQPVGPVAVEPWIGVASGVGEGVAG
jgi:RND family efflux transporter MFP subunit